MIPASLTVLRSQEGQRWQPYYSIMCLASDNYNQLRTAKTKRGSFSSHNKNVVHNQKWFSGSTIASSLLIPLAFLPWSLNACYSLSHYTWVRGRKKDGKSSTLTGKQNFLPPVTSPPSGHPSQAWLISHWPELLECLFLAMQETRKMNIFDEDIKKKEEGWE